MRKTIPFDPAELKARGTFPNFYTGEPVEMFTTPVSSKENVLAAFEGRPYWQPTPADFSFFSPTIIPDTIARGLRIDSKTPVEEFADLPKGGKDMFGVEWEFIEQVGGSMVRPGSPMMENVNDWKEKIHFPDIDSWDWEGFAAQNVDRLKSMDEFVYIELCNGAWFERLISFMDFENAAMALIDEDQYDALKELLEKTTDLYCRLVDKFCQYLPYFEAFDVHDDWGSQMAPFFSEAVARNLIVPNMRKLTDRIHSHGKYAILHSCGHIESRVSCIIDAGWDSWWPQMMNDAERLYDQYGDQLLLAVCYPMPQGLSEEAQREEARNYAEKFCKPGKPSLLSFYGLQMLTPVFNRALYQYSRLAYGQD